MTGKRRSEGKADKPAETGRVVLPRAGLAAEILPQLRGGREEGEAAARQREPAAPEPAPAGPGALAAPERIYAFADRLRSSAPVAAEPPEELETWVSFSLDGDTFALPVSHVHEIIRVGTITRVPHAPFPIRGITNLRGQVLPVVDLRLRLGLKAAALAEESRILVATSLARTIGLLVDAVQQVVRIAPSKVQPPPPDVMSDRSEYILGVFDLGRELALLLDIGQVLLIPSSIEPKAAAPARRRRRRS
jgi:purine-binding chemotaxis protein CheW